MTPATQISTMTTPPENKPVLLFVDNYYAKPASWNALESLLAKDSALQDAFSVLTFGFPSTLPLDGIAKKLAEKINRECQGCELILVSHGLGTAIIFKYLADVEKPGFISPGTFIQQIILFAPIIQVQGRPAHQPPIIQRLKYLLLFPINPTYRFITKKRALSGDLMQLGGLVSRQVINGRLTSGRKGAIPIAVICGLNDELVDLRGVSDFFGSSNQIKTLGNHLSVIRPGNDQADTWAAFRNLLTEPRGHRHTLLIRSLNIGIAVRPGHDQPQTVSKERTERTLIAAHIGTIKYVVDFSPRNICRSRFPIAFSVQANGYITEVDKSYEKYERALPSSWGTYLRLHTTYHSEFDAEPGRNPYQLILEVINGFSDAQFPPINQAGDSPREDPNYYVPFFLGKGDRYYQQITIDVDLRPFGPPGLDAGVTLHWLPDEVDYNLRHRQLMNKFLVIDTGLAYQKREIAPGWWQFTVKNVRYGTLIATWCLTNS